MDLPWGTAAAVGLLWTVGTVAYSVATALLVARASSRPRWWALLIGVLLPVLGPWLWGAVEYAALKRSGYSSRVGRGIRVTGTAVAWWLSGAVFGLAVFFPWIHLEAAVDDYGGRLDPTPLDTTLGAIVLAATAATLVLAGMLVGSAAPRRLAALLGATGALWFLTCVSSLMVYGSVDQVASDAFLWSGHEFEGEVHPGVGLWLTLAASVLVIGGAWSAVRLAVPPPIAQSRPPLVPGEPQDAWPSPADPSWGGPGPSRESTGGW